MPLDKTVQDSQIAAEQEPLGLDELLHPFGDSGTQRYSGYIQEEPNALWRDESRIDIIEQMRRTDGTVQAALQAIFTPILSTEWMIIGECDEKKEFIEENLFGGMDRTWHDFVREALNFMTFGHYAFELIWDIKDGDIWLKDLAPRIPRSIRNWELPDGSFGITQNVRTDKFPVSTAEIPANKLLILTNEKEGDDITGISVLRAAYKHFKIKDTLYRVQGISAERYGVGIPTIKLPEGYGDSDKSAAENMAKNVRSNEKSYAVLPPNYEFEIVTPSGNPQSDQIKEAIEHHDRHILLSVLASFLNLGSGTSGSFALSEDQSSFFLNSVEDKARYFAEQINKQVVKKMIELNFPNTDDCPRLVFAPLGQVDKEKMSKVVETLQRAGFIIKNKETLEWSHKTFGLPEPSEEDIEEALLAPEPEKLPPAVEKKDEKMTEEPDCEIHLQERSFRPFRKLTLQEQRVDFHRLNELFNEEETSLETALINATTEEIEKLSKRAEKSIESGDIVAIGALTIPLKGKVRTAVNTSVKESYNIGKKSAAVEAGVAPPPTPTKQTQIQNATTDAITQAYAQELENTAKDTIRNGLIVGAATPAIMAKVRENLNKKASQLIMNIAGSVVGQNINRGRKQVFRDNITKISKFQRSEILDGRTCFMCLTLDGRIVKADDPIAQMDLVHTNCRGIWVPVFTTESQPELNPIPKTALKNLDTVDGRPVMNQFTQLKRPINRANKPAQEEIKKRLNK